MGAVEAYIVARRDVGHFAGPIHVLGTSDAVDIGAERHGENDNVGELYGQYQSCTDPGPSDASDMWGRRRREQHRVELVA
jgi:hypothetical protein